MIHIADLMLQQRRNVMEKVREKQLPALRDVCEHETAEDQQQGMMADVWKWLKVRMDFDFPTAHLSPPLNVGTWQRRF